ncbi:MAG: hypothetical protein J7L15_00230 [Clostridiales bacterium]|nr:hypothetical protein [Clostridiales bacterium]
MKQDISNSQKEPSRIRMWIIIVVIVLVSLSIYLLGTSYLNRYKELSTIISQTTIAAQEEEKKCGNLILRKHQ